MIKNDKAVLWIVALIVIPGASILYLIINFFGKSDLKSIQDGLQSVVNPNLKIEQLEKQFEYSNNFSNRMALADAYLFLGRRKEALELYEPCIDGVFKDDIHFSLQLGLCYFELKEYSKAAFTLIKVKNTVEFKRSKYHLAYALSLDAMGKLELALEQFEVMNSELGNFEYRFHYAFFLSNHGEKQKSISILNLLLSEIDKLEGQRKNQAKIWKEKSETLLQELGFTEESS